MSGKYTVLAVNGSPHEAMGNTSRLVKMLQYNLIRDEFDVEEIFLNQRRITYCAGCGMCVEKGSCWIKDDYREVAEKALQADGIILASPVHVWNVTAQMKTFLDRSLGYGHRPPGSWKPGIAVGVSGGWGESWVSEYLATSLRIFGAFAVGRLTAIAIRGGSFLGKESVEQRAADLARDLADAVRTGRRYPAADTDLRYWLTVGTLVRRNREFLRADHEHWKKLGLYDSVETYVGQEFSSPADDPEMRRAWIKGLIRLQNESLKGDADDDSGSATLSENARA